MSRFLIEKNGVFYLTRGKMAVYDKAAAKTPDQARDVEWVEREFRRIHDLPHTWYKAVEVQESDFTAINTGETA